MRYNERELLSLARQPAEKAAEILMRVPKKGSVLKKRLVKLVVNFLFYFRTDEAEPIGALLLEHCRITKEEENVFSISEFCVSLRSQRENTALNVTAKSSVRSGLRHSSEPGPPGAVWDLRGSPLPAGNAQAVIPSPGPDWLLAPAHPRGSTQAPLGRTAAVPPQR
ncbi:pleckstrin homology domain-containing family J member 1 isoform X2 [Phalacrocorax aristotelis]|uniref:pleckstrin homology domain-containing family J member 1 isoform X2 n=1 Tax=Phalacrocorax aristotelis TaxID=126867 RepID=UPI003F4BCE1F